MKRPRQVDEAACRYADDGAVQMVMRRRWTITAAPPASVRVNRIIAHSDKVGTGAGATYVKSSAVVLEVVPCGDVTTTSTRPTSPAGTVAVICVALFTV